MSYQLVIVVVLLSSLMIESTPQQSHVNPEDVPKIISQGQTHVVTVGETLLLPCQVENLGSWNVLWKRGIAILTASKYIVSRDNRIRLVNGYDLEITGVSPRDQGDFVCQINDKYDNEQVHTVMILVPASVRVMPESGKVVVRKGQTAKLECRVMGNPFPTVTWTHLNDSVSISNDEQLLIEQVTKTSAGEYHCVVDNGIGPSVHRDFFLQVLYHPEIAVERSWINSAEGLQIELVCTIEANPPPYVLWYHNSNSIFLNNRIRMTSYNQNHSLLITNIQPEDFGIYTCVAENDLGKTKEHIAVSGRPGLASFLSEPLSRFPHKYNLSFELDSYLPLDELRVLYRLILLDEPDSWQDISSTVQFGSQRGGSHSITHEFQKLESGVTYEVIVQAKNKYGWSEASDIFQFRTMEIVNGWRRGGRFTSRLKKYIDKILELIQKSI